MFNNFPGAISWSTTAYDSVSKVNTFTTPVLSEGFYILISTFTDTDNVTLGHSTYDYVCPYDSSFVDIYLNFEGCTANPSSVDGAPATTITPQFTATPCLNPDQPLGNCTQCVQGY